MTTEFVVYDDSADICDAFIQSFVAFNPLA
jgi:hypothetical protein